jgi:hypothetical protein
MMQKQRGILTNLLSLLTMNAQIKKFLLLVFCIATVIFSCKKDKDNNIPAQTVDIYIYPSDPQFATSIGVVGGWAYVTGGPKGIIVYRTTNTDFMAYDRSCTYDPNSNSILKVLSDNVSIRDTVCNSKFLILDGSVTQGPASQSLKQYVCDYDGNVLHIYN